MLGFSQPFMYKTFIINDLSELHKLLFKPLETRLGRASEPPSSPRFRRVFHSICGELRAGAKLGG